MNYQLKRDLWQIRMITAMAHTHYPEQVVNTEQKTMWEIIDKKFAVTVPGELITLTMIINFN